jgi:hypothetical protein
MKKLLAIAVVLSLVLTAGSVLAAQADGEKLVRNLWNMFAYKQWDRIEAMMSPAFQSVHTFGAKGKLAEMKLLRKLSLGPYELSRFKVTHQGTVVLVSYFVSVSETIEGKRLNQEPAPRLTIFIYDRTGWQWLAHANLKYVPK